MEKIQGPGIFLAQFIDDDPPFNTLPGLARWSAELGYRGVQIPTWDKRVFDLALAAESHSYCDEIQATLAAEGLCITELGAQMQGQILALHPVYAEGFASFYPPGLSVRARQEWAGGQIEMVIKASSRLGTNTIPALSGGHAWHLAYPWPPRSADLVDEAFKELARLWLPLLDKANDSGLTFAFEPHPGSDVFDGATYERFLEHTSLHAAACINYDPSHFVLQQLDYIEFLRLYGSRIKGFHVKDAEFRPSGRVGVYGGYEGWAGRAGRFRSLGDGQVDFTRVFSTLTEIGYAGWAVLEWECCVKSPAQGAAEGAAFISRHLIEPSRVAFDRFAAGTPDSQKNRRMLGIEQQDTSS